MAYCTNEDVTNEFKSIDTTNGLITTSKIDEWISQADAYINGRLAGIYETPITGANSLLILKTISIGFVAQRIARILQVKSTTPKGDQYIPKDLIKEAKDTLVLIVNKAIILTDATSATTNGGVSSYTSDNPCSPDTQRVFRQGVEQW